jgi:hypothetical protein
MQNLDLELRKQVAKACGWINIKDCSRTTFSRSQGVVFCLTGNLIEEKYLEIIPEYELSIDAIAQEFDKKCWDYILERTEVDGVCYFLAYCDKYIGTIPMMKAETAAIALGKLFVQIHQQEQGCLPHLK